VYDHNAFMQCVIVQCIAYHDVVYIEDCYWCRTCSAHSRFLRATARSAKCVLAIVILAVYLSVRPPRPGTDSSSGEIETTGFHLITAQSLVCCDQILWSCMGEEIPSNESIKEGFPRKKSLFYRY